MRWPWGKPEVVLPRSRSVASDRLGPDEPRLTLRGGVTSHDADSSGKIQVRLTVGDSSVRMLVESDVARRLPVGQRLRFVIERES